METGDKQMNIRMIEGLHLTATNKAHIAQMISEGLMVAGNKTFRYEVTSIEGNRAALTMTKRELDSQGRKIARKGAYVVEFA
jgi:hypothetical protein